MHKHANGTQFNAISDLNHATDEQYYASTNPIHAIEFEVINDTHVECKLCRKHMNRTSFNRHKHVCKRVPKNTCPFCGKCFKTQSVHSRHKKTCKNRSSLMTNDEEIQPHLTSITNNTTNNNTTNNITNITLNFGNEDMTKLLSSSDPRLEIALKSFADTIQLIYFNKDCPENQTVRKLVKRDHSMEVMENNEWKPMLCSQGIPMLREHMGNHLKEHVNGHVFVEDITDPHVRELLYNHTKHGEVSTDTILSKVKLLEEDICPPDVQNIDSYRQCINECDQMIRRETKGMTLHNLSVLNTHVFLTTNVNTIRARYKFEPVEREFVSKRWLIPIYKETKNNGHLNVV